MPYTSRAMRQYIWRMKNRRLRHGDFRQHYIDNGGMCQALLNDGAICATSEGLEYHAPLGEAQDGNGKFKYRTLLCNFCHVYVDDNAHRFTLNCQMSRLAEDIALEQSLSGGYQAWLKRFNLIDRYVPTTIPIKKDRYGE